MKASKKGHNMKNQDQAVKYTMMVPLWSRAQASRRYPEILADQQWINSNHFPADTSSIPLDSPPKPPC